MGTLFNLPERKEKDIFSLIKKSQEYVKPKISIKGTSLEDRLELIKSNIKTHGGLLLNTFEKSMNYLDELSLCEYIGVDSESCGLSFKERRQVVGLCLCGDNTNHVYIPTGHINNITEEFDENQLSKEEFRKVLDRLYEFKKPKFVWHNYYYDAVSLEAMFGKYLPCDIDTYIISCYLDENESHNLKDLYTKYVLNQEGEVDKFGELFDWIPFCYIPQEVGANYASFDAKMTLDLWNFFKPYVTVGTKECIEYKLEKISKLIFELELPLLPHLAKMNVRGVEFDFKRAKELHDKYTKLRDEAKEKLDSLIDDPINFNSPKQVAELLYDKMKLKDLSRERKTGAEFLEKMDNPVPKAIVEVKTYDKLLGSFIDKLTEVAQEDGRIHGNFNSVGTKTKRFSSSEPNNQQLPSKFNDVRNVFKARDGYKLMGLDFSKQEIVIAAETSDDDNLRDAFHKNLDVYSHMASLAFKVPYEECLEFYPDGTTNKEGKKRRSQAKAVILGINYGKGTKATAEDLGITYEEAQNLIDDIHKAFPKLGAEIEYTEECVKKFGCVESISGVRRRLPNAQLPEYEFPTKDKYEIAKLKSGLKRCRSFNEKLGYLRANNIKNNNGFIAKAIRQAFNARVQGEAAIQCKKALLAMFRSERFKELGVNVVITVHDEQIIEFPEKYEEEVRELAIKYMKESSPHFKLKMGVDVKVMKNWE